MSRFQLVQAARERRDAFRYDVRVDAVIVLSDNALIFAARSAISRKPER